MSSFDPSSNPYDNGQPWQAVPSTPAWQRNTANSSTATPELATLLTNDTIPTAAPTAPAVQPPFAPIPSTSATAPPSSLTAAAAATELGAGASYTPVATAASATAAAKQPAFDDEPPSYEVSVIKDVPQIHDNYDHLRGPPGQRGIDLKTRIPPDSTPASHYQSGAQGSSSVGAAGSSNGAADSSGYGAIPQHPPHANLAQPSAPNILQGQISQGREDDEVHEQDMGRLLGTSNDHRRDDLDHQHEYSDTESEEPDSHWSAVGDGKAWMALSYIVVVLLPWALFCFVWTLVTLIVASVSLIIPPLGYFVAIATATSWRALARVDLVMSRAMVSRSVRQRYPHETYNVFVTSESMTSPHYRRRRPKNMWHRGSKHLKSTVNNKHTVKSMFYFLVWKLFYALPIFVVVIVFTVLTVPFMFCLLPTLLILSRALVNWQFRWAVVWLTEKPQAIALP